MRSCLFFCRKEPKCTRCMWVGRFSGHRRKVSCGSHSWKSLIDLASCQPSGPRLSRSRRERVKEVTFRRYLASVRRARLSIRILCALFEFGVTFTQKTRLGRMLVLNSKLLGHRAQLMPVEVIVKNRMANNKRSAMIILQAPA